MEAEYSILSFLVEATAGNMGGSLSHEYHYLADIGEDEVITCKSCNYSANTELVGKESCPKCDSSEGLKISRGIEVIIRLKAKYIFLFYFTVGGTYFFAGR